MADARVAELHRFPVKSLQGLRPDALELTAAGVAGDRAHALVDVASGTLMSAKRWKDLFFAQGRDDAIVLPDGEEVALDAPDADARLSAWLGRPVRLTTTGGADGELSYEMTFDPPDDGAEYVPIPAPAGSLVDLAPVHLVTTATLAGAAATHPELDWDVRRFRPNLLVEADVEPFGEDAWSGRRVRVGEAVLEVRMPTVRCAMPLRAQPGLERQPGLFAALDALHANHLGVYADVVEPGRVAVGDPVELPG